MNIFRNLLVNLFILILCVGWSDSIAQNQNSYQTDTIKIYKYCLSKADIVNTEGAINAVPKKIFAFPCTLLNCIFLSDTLLIYSNHGNKDNIEVKIIAKKISKAQLKINVKKGYKYTGFDAELTDECIDNNFSNGITELDRIILKINSKNVLVHSVFCSNLLFPHLLFEKEEQIYIFQPANSNYIFISIWGSDGAGAYNSFFIMDKKGLISEYVWQYGYGEYLNCINDLFSTERDTCNIYRIKSTGGRLWEW